MILEEYGHAFVIGHDERVCSASELHSSKDPCNGVASYKLAGSGRSTTEADLPRTTSLDATIRQRCGQLIPTLC